MPADLKQSGVRILLGSLFGSVLYVFGSLALLVFASGASCDMRPVFLLYGLIGVALSGLVVRGAWGQKGGTSSIVFVLPVTFFLLGTAIPVWRFLHTVRVCAVGAGR